MTEISDIQDEDSLRAWLSEQDSYQFSVTIAARAALRVQPLVWRAFLPARQDAELTALVFVRSSLIASVAAKCPTDAIREAARAADAAIAAARDSTDEAVDARAATDAPADAGYAITDAANASTYAAKVTAAAAYAAVTGGAITASTYPCIRIDCEHLIEGDDLWAQPLWPDGPPLGSKEWGDTSRAWRTTGAPWDFFADWYDGLREGKQPDWSLLEQIALIDSKDWEAGPERIAERIAEITSGAPNSDDRLKTALAETANGERITFNERTEKFRSEPVSELAYDYLQDTLDRLADALDVFPEPEALANQHTAIADEVQIIRKALDRYNDRPRMLHSTCIRVLGRLSHKVDLGECPSPQQDVDIADFERLLSDAATTLLEHDPLVQEAVAGSAMRKMPDIPEAGAAAIVEAADRLAEISEGVLQEELPVQARAMTDEALSEEERKRSFIATAGRLLRVWVLTGYRGTKAALEEIEGLSKTLSGITTNTAKIAGAGIFVSTPAWAKPAIDYILTLF